MQFSQLLVVASAIAAASAATFGMTGQQFVAVTTGSTFNISWYAANGPVTILLKNGEANALKTVATIATGQTGSTFLWTIPSSLPVDTYAFEADDNGPPNYSVRFLISGGPALTNTASGSASATASGTASATASLLPTSSGSSSTSGSTVSTSSSSSMSTGSTSSATTSTSSTTTSASKSSSTPTSTAPAVNGAAGLASPLAFVLLSFFAIFTLN